MYQSLCPFVSECLCAHSSSVCDHSCCMTVELGRGGGRGEREGRGEGERRGRDRREKERRGKREGGSREEREGEGE